MPKTHKSKKTGHRRLVSALLAVVMVAGLVTSAWLAVSPTVKKQEALDYQAELLTSIEQGSGDITVADSFTVEVDFYDIEPTAAVPASVDDDPVPVPKITEGTVDAAVETISASAPEQTAAVSETSAQPEAISGIGILTIEKIDLKLPVTGGVSEAQLKVALGHVPETAAIGETGNAVIAGHRSYTYGHYFNRLGEMAIGDIIGYQAKNGDVMRFEVFEITEIEPGDQSAFIQPEDKSIITLYTCTPIRVATHRLLVKAVKID